MGQELMGQQQQPQGQQQRAHSEAHSSSRKRHIFDDNNPQQQVEQRSVSGVPSGQKLANESRIPVKKSNAQGQLQASNHSDGLGQRGIMDYSQTEAFPYLQIPIAERYPTKINYFNAWSLPIQKYYKDERGPYQPEEQPAAAQQRREMRQFNAEALQELMAEQMKRQMTNNNRRRRQNLNMV